MNKIKVLSIIFFIILAFLAIYFFSNMGNFEKKSIKCENVGGTCMPSPCVEVGMQDHVEGICLKSDTNIDTNSYCCTKQWV